MRFRSPLVRGRLVQRYKRFLADVTLDSGETITAACPNTGSMLGLTAPGSAVWLSVSDSATRKYRHTWEMIEADLGSGPTLVGINSSLPNRIVEEAIAGGSIPELAGFSEMRREVRYGLNSRIDLLLSDAGGKLCYVEVKNVHFSRAPGRAEFPDAVTDRGAKHLAELSRMVAEGHRAVMVYLIQRADADCFSLCTDIDPAYAAAFATAREAGVEPLAYRCRMSPEEIRLDAPVRIAEAATFPAREKVKAAQGAPRRNRATAKRV
jgi:sugar fermentation stimulation protein A